MTEQLYQNHTRTNNTRSKENFYYTNERSKTIAYEFGFENKAYFSKFFKNRKGLSPKEFTKRNVREL